ncbi:vWA domain-containing protein [Flavobacterium tegetincola]|uniref:vWA domain-containing protein n=1 Tax=Flavobacterium tegetincola TaxID=150172 RepID=UPI00042A03EF|nr:VWA domain-containing protein [Flavobacterium tegetincola]
MDNKDKLDQQFQQAARNSEIGSVPSMENIWARVEEKLDKEEEKKPILWWKKLAVAASLLLFLTLGYQLFTNDTQDLPSENSVVLSPEIKETTAPIKEKTTEEKSEEPIAPTENFDAVNAAKILQKEQQKNAVVLQESSYQLEKKVSKISTKEADVIEISPLVLEENIIETQSSIVTSEIITDKVAGEVSINGTVISKNDGLPLPGVNVVIKGTTKGVSTDFDGKFSLKVKLGDQLVFSYIGFNESIVTVTRKQSFAIAMEENRSNLQEVVVMGYEAHSQKKIRLDEKKYRDDNRKKKNEIVTAVAIQASPNASFVSSLKGQVAGLEISKGKSQPGSNTSVVIRGISSIKVGNEPLYIIDGVPVHATKFRNLIPDEIKNINVLKDASATSIYGSRGANGVIFITTKKGKLKKLSAKQLEKKLEEISKVQPSPFHKMEEQEDYETFEENAFESPVNKPLSTFSIDVDNASYTNVRRFINNGQKVPKDAVRVEEIINFFKYNNPQPKNSDPFAITTEYSVAPWNTKHKLLRIGLQGKIIPSDQLPASNLVFLIDVSGSMNDQNKLPLLKESMKILVKELRKEDKVSIIVYAGAAGMVLPPTSGAEKQNIIDALEKLSAGGSTAGGAGIELAYKTAQDHFIKNGNNRVILATDGDFNVGGSSNSDMQTLIEEKRKSGVFLTCLGYGMGNYKDSKMEILSDKGNGNYAYIDNIQEASRFLGKEFKGSMFAIAKDVKIQIEFNPKHVKSYRLIGYENRKLRDEDFTNDAIDAGELGSGHTVTALYEIIPVGVESEFYKTEIPLKYTQNKTETNVFNDELATIKFRYKKPDGDKSIEMVNVIENKSIDLNATSSDFKFCSAVAWFGLTLRDSKLIPNKDVEAIKALAKKGISNDDEGYKAEFIRLVETSK